MLTGQSAGTEGSLKVESADRAIDVQYFARKVQSVDQLALHRSRINLCQTDPPPL